MRATPRNPAFVLALRDARRAAAAHLAAKVGLSVEHGWWQEIGMVTLLTVHLLNEEFLGGRMPVTLRHGLSLILSPALTSYRPMVRLTDLPRRVGYRLKMAI